MGSTNLYFRSRIYFLESLNAAAGPVRGWPRRVGVRAWAETWEEEGGNTQRQTQALRLLAVPYACFSNNRSNGRRCLSF
jgi:hypothetical protein